MQPRFRGLGEREGASNKKGAALAPPWPPRGPGWSVILGSRLPSQSSACPGDWLAAEGVPGPGSQPGRPGPCAQMSPEVVGAPCQSPKGLGRWKEPWTGSHEARAPDPFSLSLLDSSGRSLSLPGNRFPPGSTRGWSLVNSKISSCSELLIPLVCLHGSDEPA